jgi:acetyl-CoA carboxylase biotin carboxyl carrier protein
LKSFFVKRRNSQKLLRLWTNYKMSEQTGAGEGKEQQEQQSGSQQTKNRGSSSSSGGDHRSRANRHRSNRQGRGGHHHSLEASLNLNELREIATLFGEHGLTDLEFENENIRVRLRKELAPQLVQPTAAQSIAAVAPQQSQTSVQANQSNVAALSEETAKPAVEEADTNLKKIISPIVGTFYRAPSPDAAPFVEIGSRVSPETIVCIVEAMKLMNEIPAEISGEIVKIYVENGQPVEYGQPLFAVK